MHGVTEKKHGLRAALRSLLGALLASSPGLASGANAADEPPMVLAKTGYLFVGRQDRLVGAGLAHDRADVRRISSRRRDASLPDRDDPWRQPDRHELHRHAGRPRRLGAIFPAPRLRGLCGGPGGARPLGALARSRRARCADANLKRDQQRFAAPERFNCGRRRSCTRNGRAAGKPGDPVFDQFYASQVPLAGELPEAAGDQPRRAAWRCSTRSGRRSC